MMDDLQETWMLLQIVKEAIGHPNLKPILDKAAKRLKEIADEIAEEDKPTTLDSPPEEMEASTNGGDDERRA